MANSSILVQNETANALSLDVLLGPNRSLRTLLQPKGQAHPSVDVGDMTTLSELNANPRFRSLLDYRNAAGTAVPRVSVSVVRGSSDIAGAIDTIDSVATSDGLGPLITRTKDFAAAGATGTADDVTIYAANFPWPGILVDTQVMIKTEISGSTVQLRTATAGGGTALTSAMSSAAKGRVRDAGTGIATDGVPPVIAKNSSIYLRRDRAVAGTLIVSFQRNG